MRSKRLKEMWKKYDLLKSILFQLLDTFPDNRDDGMLVNAFLAPAGAVCMKAEELLEKGLDGDCVGKSASIVLACISLGLEAFIDTISSEDGIEQDDDLLDTMPAGHA